ncbi:MAG: glycosyltransferase [Cytophagales bacterium]|nr:glycosyltransferase [Cytophagales bacterium]
MNVFIIPSWYPSPNNPLPGIFFRDQAIALSNQFKDINIGVSSWGQNDERLLLWATSPVTNIAKSIGRPKSYFRRINDQLTEYHSPVYTWTSKFRSGNMQNITRANLHNLHRFESRFGKADIIHAHVGFPAGHIAKKLSEIHKIPYIITEHMSPFPHRYFLKKNNKIDSRLLRAYNSADAIICVSAGLEKRMYAYGISQTRVIPNLIDEDFYSPAFHVPENEKFTLFSLGRMVPQKGIDLLLKAFANIDPDAKLRIGGDGAELDNYKKLAIKLGVNHKVKWLGTLDKSQALSEYRRCNAFVLPSRHESMGVVFAEAMACGKPVIATACGGPEEFINHDCGYLVAPENQEGLETALQKMMNNYKVFNPEVIRRHFEFRFSKKIVCKQIKAIYQRIINSSESTTSAF